MKPRLLRVGGGVGKTDDFVLCCTLTTRTDAVHYPTAWADYSIDSLVLVKMALVLCKTGQLVLQGLSCVIHKLARFQLQEYCPMGPNPPLTLDILDDTLTSQGRFISSEAHRPQRLAGPCSVELMDGCHSTLNMFCRRRLRHESWKFGQHTQHKRETRSPPSNNS